MRFMDSKKFDLNTLKALDVLLREKHVSRAAALLNISQPALSRTLAKLREQFQDELLVRDGTNYVLTVRASELSKKVGHLLSEVDHVLQPAEFSAAELHGQLCFASLDIEMFLFLPTLLSKLGELAPNLELRAMTLNRGDLSVLDSGEADVAMVARDSDVGRYRRRLMYSNTHITVLNKRLSNMIDHTLTMDHFLAADHGLISVEGVGGGFVDEALAKLQLTRKIAVRVPSFMLVADLCASRDILFTVPERLGAKLANDPRLTLLKPPISTKPTSSYLYWHPRVHNDPTNRWFRQLILESSVELGEWNQE